MTNAAFFRLTRDTLYHTAGSILHLPPDQVVPGQHEPMEFPGLSEITAQVASLTERVAALESARDAPETVTAPSS